jgi:predicted RNA-binding protein with PUA domain
MGKHPFEKQKCAARMTKCLGKYHFFLPKKLNGNRVIQKNKIPALRRAEEILFYEEVLHGASGG